MDKVELSNFEKTKFEVGGRESYFLSPENPLPGNPWAWRTEFFGSFADADYELLRKGWHLAYHCVSDMFGCPEAIESMKAFHSVMVDEYGMSSKPIQIGYSRGGMYAVNFAAAYPECVAGIYIDAPVLDMRSWPGALGIGLGSPHNWEMCSEWYHLDVTSVTEATKGLTADKWPALPGNPIENAEKLAEAGVPVLMVAGDSDEDVPYCENGEIFIRRYKAKGGNPVVIIKPGVAHHPHSLTDVSPIIEFCEKAVGIR